MRTLVVTGAGGYIGRNLVAAARAEGWRVVAAARHPVGGADTWIPYRFESGLPDGAIPERAVVVHLAAQTGVATDPEVEIRAARQLAALARQRSARLVFVSSQTARAEAPTAYGRTKWAIERIVAREGGVNVRAGLVYGGTPGGLYAALLRLLRTRRYLPALRPAPRVQPIHVEDLARALLRIGELPDAAGSSWGLAAAQPMPFDAFLRALASGRGHRPPQFIPLPAAAAPIGAKLLDLAGARADAERLRSLCDLPPMPADDIRRLGIELRPLREGAARRNPQRRALAREGYALLRYVSGAHPGIDLVRRYVRVVERLRNGRALGLPRWIERWPPSLRALDQPRWLRGWPELDWRIAGAAAIAEASCPGAGRFLLLRPAGPMGAIATLVATGALEGLARFGGWPLRALVRPPVDG